MKRKHLLPALVAACLLLTACHKTCICRGYGATDYTFSADEVDTYAGGNCSSMRDFPIPNHYSVCNWE